MTATASSSRSTAATSPRLSTRWSCSRRRRSVRRAASVEAINRELALPLDDIITDATTVLDRYAGHDEDIIARLRHLLYRAREIRSLIHKAGSTVAPQTKQNRAIPAPRLGGTRILVVDADEAIRRSAHHLLGCQGASVETARDAHEAIALMRQTPYSAALVDIRLPDLDGYEAYKRLREVQPNAPIILMTGFGWDPSHSIVKARQEGLQTVLYKPFRADRLMEAVEQALRASPAVAPSVWLASPGRGSSQKPRLDSQREPCLNAFPTGQSILGVSSGDFAASSVRPGQPADRPESRANGLSNNRELAT